MKIRFCLQGDLSDSFKRSDRNQEEKPAEGPAQGLPGDPASLPASCWGPADTGFNRDVPDVCGNTQKTAGRLPWCPFRESTAAFVLGIHLYKRKDLKREEQGSVLTGF